MSEGRLAIGATFADKYRVVREIGRGGMGAVYEAEHTHSKGRVALKVIREDRDEPSFAKRVLAEARALAKLSHPNIVRLIDVGTFGATGSTATSGAVVRSDGEGASDGLFYLVEEFIEGTTLRDVLDERLILDTRELLELIVPLVDALEYAHAEGVVHRDIKPENIVMGTAARGQRAQPKLIDFGIALVATEDRATRANTVLGTPRYMAPEQAWGRDDIDGRADLWALGALAFECLVGAPPYEGPNDRAVLAEIVAKDPPQLGELSQSIDEQLADVLMRALVRSRDDRVQSAAVWKQALLSLRAPIANEPWYRRLVATYGSIDTALSEERREEPAVLQPERASQPAPIVIDEPQPAVVESKQIDSSADSQHRRARGVRYAVFAAIACAIAIVPVVRGASSRASEVRVPVSERPHTVIDTQPSQPSSPQREPARVVANDASVSAQSPIAAPIAVVSSQPTSSTLVRRTAVRTRVANADAGSAARPAVVMGANRAPIVDESE